MNCREFEEYLQDYLDGDIESRISDTIEEHLLNCSKCRKALNEYECIQEFIKLTDTPEEMPSELFFKNTFENALKQSKMPDSDENVRTFFRKFESFMQSIIFGRKPFYQFARTAAVLICGVVIGVSAFKKLPQETIIKPNDTKIVASGVEKINDKPLIAAAPVSSDNSSINPTSTPLSDLISSLPHQQNPSEEIGKSPNAPKIASTPENVINPNPVSVAPEFPATFPHQNTVTNNESTQLVQLLKAINELNANQYSKPGALAMSSQSTIQANNKLNNVADEIKKSDILNTLQGMKLNLYLSGDYQYITEVHRIEQVIYDIVSSSSPETQDIDAFKIYQKAENSLLNKNYFDAMKYYYASARNNPNSLIAFLSYFQLANIDFEVLGNFRSALVNYEKCIENFPSHFLTDEKKNLIHERVDLLTKNSQSDWHPLSLYLQAKNARKTSVARILYQKIIADYPTAPLAKESIINLTQIACSDNQENPSFPEELIAFYQNCIDSKKYDSGLCDNMQLGIADIFNLALKDSSQAMIEYAKLTGNNPNSEVAVLAQSRISKMNSRP